MNEQKANELVPNSATVEAVDILTSAKVNETSNIVEAKNCGRTSNWQINRYKKPLITLNQN